jgi:hypothetical protein
VDSLIDRSGPGGYDRRTIVGGGPKKGLFPRSSPLTTSHQLAWQAAAGATLCRTAIPCTVTVIRRRRGRRRGGRRRGARQRSHAAALISCTTPGWTRRDQIPPWWSPAPPVRQLPSSVPPLLCLRCMHAPPARPSIRYYFTRSHRRSAWNNGCLHATQRGNMAGLPSDLTAETIAASVVAVPPLACVR